MIAPAENLVERVKKIKRVILPGILPKVLI